MSPDCYVWLTYTHLRIIYFLCFLSLSNSAISRNVFHPVPNVDSVLITLDRIGPPPPDDLRKLVRAAFAHRRKALPRSLATAGYGGNEIRDRARAALERLELPLDVRAERLSPDQFRALLEELAR